MDPGTVDAEEINAIFRAAHSIKGGSGTFGFKNVSDFTHVMETLLDEMRDGRRSVTADAVEVLLQSVDVLREMLEAARDNGQADEVRVADQRAGARGRACALRRCWIGAFRGGRAARRTTILSSSAGRSCFARMPT
jgi:chemotaxis protein histidine kinase CheA